MTLSHCKTAENPCRFLAVILPYVNAYLEHQKQMLSCITVFVVAEYKTRFGTTRELMWVKTATKNYTDYRAENLSASPLSEQS